MSLEVLLQTLCAGQLRLTRIDKFADPFEGSVPKQQIDDQLPLFSSRNMFFVSSGELDARPPLDPWTEMTLRRRAMTRSAHASCWSAGHESEAMWRLYCNDEGVQGQGVAVESTLGTIEASVEHLNLVVSPVRYRYYHEGAAFDDELDSFFHKRQGFAHEAEVRLLSYDQKQCLQFALAFNTGSAQPAELPDHLFLEWAATAAVERLLISPYASQEYEERVKTAVAAIEPLLTGKVQLSVLSERRHAPRF